MSLENKADGNWLSMICECVCVSIKINTFENSVGPKTNIMYHSHTFENFECMTMIYNNVGFGYVYLCLGIKLKQHLPLICNIILHMRVSNVLH